MNHRDWTYPLLAAASLLAGCILSLDRQQLVLPGDGDESLDPSDMIESADGPHVDQDLMIDGPVDSDPADTGFDEAEAVCATIETACGNGLDDDCDGDADCRDPDCDGSACDDADLCTYGDGCVERACIGQTVYCPSETCTTRACNGTSECSETYNDGADCDDGDPCTYDDRCVYGSCGGTAVVCSGDACISRTCNGSSSCTVAYASSGTACPDDGNACTRDICDGSGSCTHPTQGNGTSCGTAYELRCCGGACVNIFTDDGNCGGCGITCEGRGCAILPGTSYAGCHCTYNSHCRVNGPTWTCYDPGSGLYCNCQDHADCAPGQVCEEPLGHNWCHY